ncbi:glucose/galactose MFS transporter [Massilia sp. KIM]|uniref:sugar MFS transporter n=1 Tax=Massilia sp. KIM TaxID=1955422 RepID=UPI0009D27C80|nr:sugar MFS transporter [Massilia sp. KIM]OON62459.1 glucose/galactose MFS transporter [Massilia sp. KIM]
MITDNPPHILAPATSTRQVTLAMGVVALLFFVLGCATWINGSLIPFLKIACDLNNFQALWVTFAFYIAYTVMALPAAAVLRRTGYRRAMGLGLAIMGGGALLFVPAARSGEYGLFLLALFTLASGMTLMQTAINPYLVCIGPRDSAATRISIMGLFNKGAGVLVPLMFTSLVLTGMDAYSDDVFKATDAAGRAALRAELSQRLATPYAMMAGALVLMALLVAALPIPEIPPDRREGERSSRFDVLRHPQLVLGAAALFVYVGVEVIAGDTIGLYGQHLGLPGYASLTSLTMAFMVVGYLAGIAAIPRYISQSRALQVSAALGILFSLVVTLAPAGSTVIAEALLGWSPIRHVPDSVLCLALLGLANALVWPAIWPLALADLGSDTANGAALLIMGIAGGALLPMAYGALSDHSSPQAAYWLLLPCYAWILFYALKGQALRRWP